MKKLYSIGQTSKMMGVSIQTLRYYSNINLLHPKYVNPQTGYRYYSNDQFHFIDRIKYLQNLGLSLTDIRTILNAGNISLLIHHLTDKKLEVQKEIEAAQEKYDDLQWYIDYFNYVVQDYFEDVPYKLVLKKRYLLAVDCKENEEKAKFHIRLNTLKHSKGYRSLKYKRQFSYIVDLEKLLHKELKPLNLGMFIKQPPDFTSEYVIEIPGGEYLCFKGKILTDEWNPAIISMLLSEKQLTNLKSTLVLANEFENSLVDYSQCTYEVQILVSKQE